MPEPLVEFIIARLDDLAWSWNNQPHTKRSYTNRRYSPLMPEKPDQLPGAWAGWSLTQVRVDELLRLAGALGCAAPVLAAWPEIIAKHRRPDAPRLDDHVADTVRYLQLSLV